MPEPDFEQILRPDPTDFGRMARSTMGFLRDDPERLQALELNIIDMLRQAWNARGAADLQLLFAASAVDEGLTRLEVRGLRNDMRTLDR